MCQHCQGRRPAGWGGYWVWRIFIWRMRYLSQPNGTNSGIPAINGLDAEVFASVMHAYKVGDVEHPVMQMVAGRLDGEQIASLAVYFASRLAAQ